MPLNYSRKLFDRWLRGSAAEFAFMPYNIRQGRHEFRFEFAGIHPAISCYIGNDGSCGVTVNYDKVFWDLLLDLDLDPRRDDSRRWYCDCCLERTFYASRDELWLKHAFEPLLCWVNGTLAHNNWLVLLDYRGGIATKILGDSELAGLDHKDIAHVLPLQIPQAK